jgi:hypothetical protein
MSNVVAQCAKTIDLSWQPCYRSKEHLTTNLGVRSSNLFKRLSVHTLPPGENRAETVLIWRKGAGSPNIRALQQLLCVNKQTGRAKAKRKV